jgi:hypothetical protein
VKNAKPIDDLEMHEILRLIYPEHIKSDDDEYFELSQDICEVLIPLGNGAEVTLAELLGRVVMLTPPMKSSLAGRLSHCLGSVKLVPGDMQMTAAVRRDFVS